MGKRRYKKQKYTKNSNVNQKDTKARDKNFLNFVKENFISIMSLCISCITLIIYIRANNLSQSNIDMQYKLNSINLNMNVSYDDEIMSCKIINSGGNIQEATLTPHIYLELRYCPEYARIEKSHAIEISDFFSDKFMEGVYWTPVKTYNVEESGWTLDIDQDKMNQALELLFRIQGNLEMPNIASQLSLCFEIRYTDFAGNSHEGWYYADYFNGGLLKYMDKNFYLSLDQYLDAKSIHMEEAYGNDSIIDIITKDYEEVLSMK